MDLEGSLIPRAANLGAASEESPLLGTDYATSSVRLHDVEFVDLGDRSARTCAELVRLRDAGRCRFIGMTGYSTAMTRVAMIPLMSPSATHTARCQIARLDTPPPTEAEERGRRINGAMAVALGLLTEPGRLTSPR